MSDGMLSISWNNHKATFYHVLSTLREKEKYTDVTVACEGKFYPVHKLVLSTCSDYFEKIFDNTPCKHPVIVLKDIAWEELEALLSYMYDGVVSVAQNDLPRVIKAAEALRIKGLAISDEPLPSRGVSSRKSSHRSTDDRSSPNPKRKRKEENAPQSSVCKLPASSPVRASPVLSESELNRTHTGMRWKDHNSEQSSNRALDDEWHQSAHATSSSPYAPVEVIVDESLIKEETEDTVDNRDDILDLGVDHGSLRSDSRFDGSVGVDDEILHNKFEECVNSPLESQSQSQSIPDAVVEALTGPSGMQVWLRGCEMPGSLSGMEGCSGDGRQNVHPPKQSQGPIQESLELPGAPQEDFGHHLTDNNVTNIDCLSSSDPFWEVKTEPDFYESDIVERDSCARDSIRSKECETPYKCPECKMEFTSASSLRRHERTHTVNEMKNEEFQYSDNLGEYSHKSDFLEYGVAVSKSFSFSEKEEEKYSSKLALQNQEKLLSCMKCEKVFTCSSKLAHHNMVMHNGDKSFKCRICGKFFTRNDHLNRHMVIHTGVKLFTCRECGKSFALSEHLTKHLKIHTGEKPFTCDECGKSFARSDHLARHIVIHTGEKSFTCGECGKSFAQREHLVKHMKVHNKGKLAQHNEPNL